LPNSICGDELLNLAANDWRNDLLVRRIDQYELN
jgi:hypothetical protein